MAFERVRRMDGGICAVEGVLAGGVKGEKGGLALVRAAGRCVGMYTKNAFQAAPLLITRSALAASRGRTDGIVVSSGNANSFTGK
ncbi:MAG: bifunctional ornithine acetyltransferase/N-acetylglutamate synthase, partial [Methermicoccaceae archaeon]